MFVPRITALLAVLLASVPLAGEVSPPSLPDVTSRKTAILAWFQALQQQPELRLVSGQFCGWGGRAALADVEKIHRASGRWPALAGFDYCTWEHGTAEIATDNVNALAERWWRDGGLVSISWHAPNPGGGELKDKGPPLRQLLDPATPAHRRWMESLDRIAAGLAELQRAGVVVIWRPLHEMNGGWFWWGAQPPAEFIAVWRHMHDYFTREKQLRNLIWAYSPNHGSHTADYYPGDAYAELTGVDAYTDHVDPSHIKGFAEVVALGRPAGLTEFGPHGASNPPGDYDFRRLLDGVARHFPTARHFLCWNDKWNPAENHFAKELYTDPRVLTRGDIPPGLTGR